MSIILILSLYMCGTLSYYHLVKKPFDKMSLYTITLITLSLIKMLEYFTRNTLLIFILKTICVITFLYYYFILKKSNKF